jgi:hypothetical protein
MVEGLYEDETMMKTQFTRRVCERGFVSEVDVTVSCVAKIPQNLEVFGRTGVSLGTQKNPCSGIGIAGTDCP